MVSPLLLNHGVLIAATVVDPSLPWLLLFALPLGLGLAIATLTVLHDAGHRRFSRRPGRTLRWPQLRIGGLRARPLDAETPGPPQGHPGLSARRRHPRRPAWCGCTPRLRAGQSPLPALLRLVPLRPGVGRRAAQPGDLPAYRCAGLHRGTQHRAAAGHLPAREGRVPARARAVLRSPGLPPRGGAPDRSMTVASVIAAVMTVVGHINIGLEPPPERRAARSGRAPAAYDRLLQHRQRRRPVAHRWADAPPGPPPAPGRAARAAASSCTTRRSRTSPPGRASGRRLPDPAQCGRQPLPAAARAGAAGRRRDSAERERRMRSAARPASATSGRGLAD